MEGLELDSQPCDVWLRERLVCCGSRSIVGDESRAPTSNPGLLDSNPLAVGVLQVTIRLCRIDQSKYGKPSVLNFWHAVLQELKFQVPDSSPRMEFYD